MIDETGRNTIVADNTREVPNPDASSTLVTLSRISSSNLINLTEEEKPSIQTQMKEIPCCSLTSWLWDSKRPAKTAVKLATAGTTALCFILTLHEVFNPNLDPADAWIRLQIWSELGGSSALLFLGLHDKLDPAWTKLSEKLNIHWRYDPSNPPSCFSTFWEKLSRKKANPAEPSEHEPLLPQGEERVTVKFFGFKVYERTTNRGPQPGIVNP